MQLKKPLTNIYNASLESKIFPDQLKIAKVVSVHKRGDKKDIQNYRPIALLSVFSKLLEKLVYNRLGAFIKGNGVLSEAQHGFRIMKSTETALQTFIQSTQKVFEKKFNPIGIFLDLTKAYDVLSHKVLLSKLHSYGIRGMANLWFESYLSHHKQCVEINTADKGIRVLTTKEIEHGVPQGSILGPILFSYINDLPLNITGTKTVFADDTNILVTDENTKNIRYKLNNVMTDL